MQSISDETVLADFIAFAPYAYDAGFWRSDYAKVAMVSDEGTAMSVWLSEEQRAAVAAEMGDGRVVSMGEWRARYPSLLRRLGRRLFGQRR